MDSPDVIALAQLAVGDCFEFAGRRTTTRLPDEQVPRWKVAKTGPDFYGVTLEKPPGTLQETGFIAAPMRMASSTHVKRIKSAVL